MSDLFFNDSGGYRILMKNSNLFSTSFSFDMMIKYYPSSSQDPTFPTTTSGYSRIILFGMGGGTGSNTKGVFILLERYNGNDYITGIYNSNNTSGWTYLPSLNNGDGIQGIEVSSENFYHITFNFFQGSSHTNSTYELNVIEGPIIDPQSSDVITRSGTTNGYVAYQPQCGFGCPNESIGDTQTTFPNLDYDTGNGTIYTYSARNIAVNFIRLWDGNVNNNSTNYNPISLYNLDVDNTLIDIKSTGVPTDPHPYNVGTEQSDDTSDDYQPLIFQLYTKDATSLSDLRNTAYFNTTNHINGVAPTLTHSPTGYSPLEHYAVNYSVGGTNPISLESSSISWGDPHIVPYIGRNYDIPKRGTYLLFSYEDDYRNFTKLITIIRKLGKEAYELFNDTLIIHEKNNEQEYIANFYFNTFEIDNLRTNMIFTEENTLRWINSTIKQKTKKLLVFCINKNIKFVISEWRRNVALRINNELIQQCSGGLINKDKLIKLN